MQTLTQTKPPVIQLLLAFFAVYFIWGSTYLAIRFTTQSIPPFLMASCRFLVAGSILYLFARRQGAVPERIHWQSASISALFLLLGGNGLMAWSLQYINSSLAAILVATVPFWMVLVAWLGFKARRPGSKETAGLVLGFVGILWLVISTGSQGNGRATNPVGIAIVMLSAISWAMGSVYAARHSPPGSPMLLIALQMLVGGGLLAITGTLLGEWQIFQVAHVSVRSLLALGYLTFFGSLIAFTAYSWLLRVVPPSLASTYAYVNPVVAILLGWSLGGEQISLPMLLASGVIVASVVLITQAKKD